MIISETCLTISALNSLEKCPMSECSAGSQPAQASGPADDNRATEMSMAFS